MGSSRTVSCAAIAAAFVCLAGCKDTRLAASLTSETQVRTHVAAAREAATRMTTGLTPLLEQLAPAYAPMMAGPNLGDLRFELLQANSRQTSAGSLRFFATGFVAAAGRDGTCLARDIAEPDDRMRGMHLSEVFPPVARAVSGTSATGVGELPATGDLAVRVFLVGAAPVRDAQGAVLGALTAGMSYTALAHALQTALVARVGQEPILWLGLRRGGRVFPSATDHEVAERWRIPAPLLRSIPADADARLERDNGVTSWHFVENDQRGWGGVVARLADLEGTQVVIFRSEARQN